MNVSNPAGFGVRFFALILDGILVSLVTGLISLAIYNEFFMESYSPLDWLVLIYHIILPVLWYGYTIGKRLLGIRIVKVNGENVGIGNMLMRHLVAGLVYALTLGIGVIVSVFMVAIREDKRAIHDFVAGTYVTYDSPDKLEEGVV
ncbi:RDD family protein [Virgibacillus kekensis]|uniref:RDD family protein n=1 Tax=Virgibacillus kekensis TaxID=202261 RepID=A0ABV9DNU4_9BACI